MAWRETDELFALDLATVTGWCRGPIRGTLTYGSHRLAPDGSSAAACYAGLIDFLVDHLSAFRPKRIIFEAPIDPRHLKKITVSTIRKLNGFPAIVEGVAYKLGVYDIEEVETGDLKHYWHHSRNLSRETVKPMTFAAMRRLGYDPKDYDAADAIAVHRYGAATIDPALQIEASPLFRARAR